jgi:putative transcription factor
LPPNCEICGAAIKSAPTTVEIDGAILGVCGSCAGRGKAVRVPARKESFIPRAARQKVEPEMEIDPDFRVMVRKSREKRGLSQEQLGRLTNLKPSVISHVESGRLKPDLVLARRLMHELHINLLVSATELEGETSGRDR